MFAGSTSSRQSMNPIARRTVRRIQGYQAPRANLRTSPSAVTPGRVTHHSDRIPGRTGSPVQKREDLQWASTCTGDARRSLVRVRGRICRKTRIRLRASRSIPPGQAVGGDLAGGRLSSDSSAAVRGASRKDRLGVLDGDGVVGESDPRGFQKLAGPGPEAAEPAVGRDLVHLWNLASEKRRSRSGAGEGPGGPRQIKKAWELGGGSRSGPSLWISSPKNVPQNRPSLEQRAKPARRIRPIPHVSRKRG
jgi:hypothetical protein